MGSAGQSYGSPSRSYGSINTIIAPSGQSMAKNSDFLKAFGNGSTSSRVIEPQQIEKTVNPPASLGINPSEQSFFEFDPHSDTGSPFHNQSQFGTPGGGISGWGSDLNFRPLSPPNSASPFSRDWNYGFQNMATPSTSNIFSNTQSNDARAPYGQVTPPDDEQGDESLFDYQLQEQQQEPSDTTTSKKRKRGNGSNPKDSSQAPTKRSRKTNSRISASSNPADPSKPEEVRRSKFLERNRVAASKCRQKKKEWTQNLEDRGRELQKDNNSLRMMVDSLRQEVLFMKGEVLRHSACDDPIIHNYLKSGATGLPGGLEEMTMKRESSPFESMPSSPMGGVGTAELDEQSVLDEEVTQQEQTNAEIAGDENALEALLTSSINHDTSEEGITNQVGG